MIIMHGMFDLADEIEESDFHEAFVSLSEHLQDSGMMLNWRCMRHQPHDGYNANEPPTTHYVSIEFQDMSMAEECWRLIEDGREPLKSLHQAVFSKVRNTAFFLSADIRRDPPT